MKKDIPPLPENRNTADTQKTTLLRYGLLVTVIVALAGTFFFVQSNLSAAPEPDKKAAKPAMPPMTVEVTEVLTAPATREIVTVGTLEANESVIIRSEVSGRITAINFDEGEGTTKETGLFTLDQSELRAELDKAKADLDLHYANYRRARSLLKNNAISKRERDEAYAQWQSDKANIRLIKARLAKTVISAPFDGALGLRTVSIGDYINAGEDLVNIEDVSRLKVSFKIPEIHALLAKPGQTVRLSSDATGDRTFEAEVYAVNPRMDAQSRSAEVKAVMDNTEGILRPGQFVRVSLAVGQNENALFVPEQAIIPQPERMFVWKVADNSSATMAEVTIGKREKGFVEIKSGLGPDDLVITGGIQKIGEGAPINPVRVKAGLFAGRMG